MNSGMPFFALERKGRTVFFTLPRLPAGTWVPHALKSAATAGAPFSSGAGILTTRVCCALVCPVRHSATVSTPIRSVTQACRKDTKPHNGQGSHNVRYSEETIRLPETRAASAQIYRKRSIGRLRIGATPRIGTYRTVNPNLRERTVKTA